MRIRRFLKDRSAASATEFAVIAPVMAMAALGMIDGWSFVSSILDTRAAVQAGAKYVIQGGLNESSVQSVAMSAWAGRPQDAQITVEKKCYCTFFTADCAGLCVWTNKPPVTLYNIEATGTWTAPFEVKFLVPSQKITHKQVIRVR